MGEDDPADDVRRDVRKHRFRRGIEQWDCEFLCKGGQVLRIRIRPGNELDARITLEHLGMCISDGMAAALGPPTSGLADADDGCFVFPVW